MEQREVEMGMTRKDFLTASAAFAAAPAFAEKPEEIRSVLVHWGANQWGDFLPEGVKEVTGATKKYKPAVKFDDNVWTKIVDEMVAKKMNMAVIDLGEFPVYPSHPELAIPGSRSPDWIRAEVRRMKSLGLEPIPKMNFSAAHDAWLQEYGCMLTTKRYHQVCRELIKDAAEMFDHPRFLHIGYDEEKAHFQHGFQCVRTDEVWWHDFLFFVKTVEDAGMRPWMWSDYGWDHEDFAEKCPKSVLQSNWYYDSHMKGYDIANMSRSQRSWKILNLFLTLDKAGFDQVPCGSNWKSKQRQAAGGAVNESVVGLVKFCREHLSPERLKGFMMAPWATRDLKRNVEGIGIFAKAFA